MHYNTIRYKERRTWLIQKLGGKCQKCGSVESLEFHHIDPTQKSFCVSKAILHNNSKVIGEILKCELRCKKCHKGEHRAVHGLGMYSHQKCRCDICKSAWNERTKIWKANAKLKRDLLKK